jgi:hypothetical protein
MNRFGFALSMFAVVATAAWAYHVNYRTKTVLGQVDRLRSQIAAEREGVEVLRVEWAYLNAPDRLARLVALHNDRLGLEPMGPQHFDEVAAIPFPPRNLEPDDVSGDLGAAAACRRAGSASGTPTGGLEARMSDFAAPPFRQAHGRGQSVSRSGATTRPRDDWRLIVVILALLLVYAAVGIRMGLMALNEPVEPQLARGAGMGAPVRGEIVDRNGNLLAANLPAFSLYAHPREIKDPAAVARDLAAIFPDMSAKRLLIKRLSRGSSFVWIKRPITPRQRRRVLDLGYPGLKFGSRAMRIYPAGRTVAHIVGNVRAGNEDVRFAELVGAGGVEGYFDERLRDPARLGTPLELSIDLTVQAALRDVLCADGCAHWRALGHGLASGLRPEPRAGAV